MKTDILIEINSAEAAKKFLAELVHNEEEFDIAESAEKVLDAEGKPRFDKKLAKRIEEITESCFFHLTDPVAYMDALIRARSILNEIKQTLNDNGFSIDHMENFFTAMSRIVNFAAETTKLHEPKAHGTYSELFMLSKQLETPEGFVGVFSYPEE